MPSFKQRLINRLRILPILIAVATLAFMVRIGDAVITYKHLSGEAMAENTAATDPAPPETQNSDAKPSADPVKAPDATAESTGTQPSTDTLKSSETDAKKPEGEAAAGESTSKDVTLPDLGKGGPSVWEDAKDVDEDYSTVKEDMFKDLASRRKQLDDREKTLDEREALLEAAQKELDRKYKELTGMRDEIQGLLKTQSEQEAARLESLVKIYTGMKPKDAARIFNTLDIDILVEVVGKMAENKSAPIIAAMDADKARALTTLLAEQKKLPELP